MKVTRDKLLVMLNKQPITSVHFRVLSSFVELQVSHKDLALELMQFDSDDTFRVIQNGYELRVEF